MAGQLVLQAAGFGQVVEQHQLPGLGIERARCDGQPPAVTQRDFMAVILARGEAAGDHLAPELTDQWLAQQLACRRVGLAHIPLIVDDDHPAGQQVEQVLQTIGQALFSSSSAMR